jgi:hypothetical protein
MENTDLDEITILKWNFRKGKEVVPELKWLWLGTA